jgi:succinate dehydrogenase / fumarate reductase, cytochrome b subunit
MNDSPDSARRRLTSDGRQVLGYTETAVARRARELGPLYKGTPAGQWSWVAHRITGVGILLFLFAHVVDTALVGWGPETYNTVIELYHHPLVQIMELGLVGAVIYHALNGLRVMIIDFWPGAAVHNSKMVFTTVALFAAAMAPITYLMGMRILEDLF